MRIEELTPEGLAGLPLAEIAAVRQRCVQIWKERFADPSVKVHNGLTREGLAMRYVLVRREFERRGTRLHSVTLLDKAVAPTMESRAIWGMDLYGAGDIVLSKGHVFLVGPWVEDPAGAAEIQVVVLPEAARSFDLARGIAAIIEKQSGKLCRIVYSASGPEGEHVPAYDLVLRPRETLQKVAGPPKPVTKELTPEEQADYDAEKNLIMQNGDKPEAKRSHKFRPAKWTNSDRRAKCLLCGGPEPASGMCDGTFNWHVQDVVPAGSLMAKLPERLEKGEPFDILKPFPSEHSCRKHNPSAFEPGSFRRSEREHEDKKYSVIYGRLKGADKMTEQTARYPKDTWTADEARAHCKAHGGILFEPASEKAEKSAGEARFEFRKVDKVRHLVGGVVYEPDAVDTQGDYTDEGEIDKAMERFMLSYFLDPGRIKVQHKGVAHKFPVIECFQAEADTTKGGKALKKGAWWLMVKITSPDVWEEVKAGRLTGWSMGGRASEAAA